MKRLFTYLAITFGLTWGTLIPAGIALGTFEHGEASSPVMIALIAVSMFFPLVGAFVVNHACKPEERIDLGLKPQVARNRQHYLVAWFVPAALAVLGCAVFFALNPQWFDPTMASFAESTATAAGTSPEQLAGQASPSGPMLVATILFALVIAPFVNMVPSLGEEVGWRGMLFPTLAEHLSERTAALVSGVIWGLWHAPAIAMGHNYGMSYPGFPLMGILIMTLLCTAMGCWLAYLRLQTESVWPCALAHGAFNAVANIGLVFCSCGQTPWGPSPLGLVAGIPLLVLGGICLLRLKS